MINQLKTPNQVKYTILDALQDMTHLILDGHVNALEGKILLDELRKSLDNFETQITDQVLSEGAKYNKQHYGDYYVEVKTGGGRYQYDHIDAINELQLEIKRLQKIAQDSYKMSLNKLEMISQDGELISPAKFVPSKEYIVIKRKGG
jgi:hypothetical protein